MRSPQSNHPKLTRLIPALLAALVALLLLAGPVRGYSPGSNPTTGASQFIEPGQIPAGLTAAEWAGIRAMIPANRPLRDAFTPGSYIKASNTASYDNFGWSVDMDGDTLVVGAHLEDSSATGVNGDQGDNNANGAGAVYIFVRSGGVWSQQAYLKASSTGVYDNFGISVAISGDTLVVGAKGEDGSATGVNGADNNSATDAGAAYVFTRSGTTWSQQAYLKASNTGINNKFGSSVAIDGDTAVVGAVAESSTADQSGAAYVFTRSGATWSQQAYLKASNAGAYDNFGNSVAIDGDTLVVGATYEASNATGVNGTDNNSAANAGAAYVFTRSGVTWSQQAYLKASNTAAFDQFGYCVALSGDTIVVGATYEASNATGVNAQITTRLPTPGRLLFTAAAYLEQQLTEAPT